jgi:hypothetical protein
MEPIASNFLFDCPAILFELLGKSQELVSPLSIVFLILDTILSFMSQSLTGLLLCPLNLWLQPGLLV